MTKADDHTTMAMLLAQDHRAWPEVFDDAFHGSDSIMRYYQSKIVEDGPTVELMNRYGEAQDRVLKIGKAGVSTGLVKAKTIAIERDLDAQGRVLVQALTTAIDAGLDRSDIINVDPRDRDRLRAYMLAAAQAAMTGQAVPDIAPRPVYPDALMIKGRASTDGTEQDHMPSTD